jgi:hypothetical protein
MPADKACDLIRDRPASGSAGFGQADKILVNISETQFESVVRSRSHPQAQISSLRLLWPHFRSMPPPDVLRVDRISNYAERYNLLKSFEEQAHTVDFAALQLVAEIFWRHSQHERFGIILLHRHVKLDANHVIVQSMPTPDQILCTPRAFGEVALYPSSFCLGDDGFFPVEFALTEMATPNQEFLSELAKSLRLGNLVNTLGFAALAPGSQCWIEHELHNQAGTLATPGECHGLVGAVATEWQCVCNGALVEAVARKKCVEPDSGGHVRNPPT